MTTNVIANSLSDAAPLILKALRSDPFDTQVFIETEFQGYFADLKFDPTPADEMTEKQLRRLLRMVKSPQPYDVKLTQWPRWMYAGMHRGEKSSAF